MRTEIGFVLISISGRGPAERALKRNKIDPVKSRLEDSSALIQGQLLLKIESVHLLLCRLIHIKPVRSMRNLNLTPAPEMNVIMLTAVLVVVIKYRKGKA